MNLEQHHRFAEALATLDAHLWIFSKKHCDMHKIFESLARVQIEFDKIAIQLYGIRGGGFYYKPKSMQYHEYIQNQIEYYDVEKWIHNYANKLRVITGNVKSQNLHDLLIKMDYF